MRQVPGRAEILTALLVLLPAPALAEDVYNLNQNQTGFTLPGVTLPQGQDEVRAADGTTCRSAVGGSGAYFDIGVIRGNTAQTQDLATYGRVVIPFGKQVSRLNCARLYELEVERLQMELKLLKMGLGQETTASIAKPEATGSRAPTPPAVRPAAKPRREAWASEGWTLKGAQK